MNSTEKVWRLVEELQDSEDSEIREAFGLEGIPMSLLRLVLAGVTDQIPQDPAKCDELLTNVGNFCLELRSDTDETPA